MSTILEYPYDSSSPDVVTLPSPQFGNTHAIDTKVNSYRSMSGIMKSYRRTGNLEILSLSIENINLECNATLIDETVALLKSAVGEYIKLTFDGGIWQVKCTTPTPRFEYRNQVYSTTLTFEGTYIGSS